jgi:hypothetical protein
LETSSSKRGPRPRIGTNVEGRPIQSLKRIQTVPGALDFLAKRGDAPATRLLECRILSLGAIFLSVAFEGAASWRDEGFGQDPSVERNISVFLKFCKKTIDEAGVW